MHTLVQLEYIVAVDTYRHFVTAAEKCFVTQPTLSMQIKKLEEDLGVVIFDRTKQPIIPTEIGVEIIEQARRTIAESSRVEELVADYNKSVSGKLTVGIIPSLAPYLLPLFIGNFSKKYPDVQIKIVELLTDELTEQLKKDLIDVAILVTPVDEPGITEQPLFYEELLLYVNKNHTLASKKSIKSTDLTKPDLWLLEEGHCFRSQVVNLCRYKKNIKADYNIEYASGSLETIKKLVEIEGGFTLLPQLAIDKPSAKQNTLVKPINTKPPLREVSFVYTRNHAKRRILNLLADGIKTAVPQEMLNKSRGNVITWR